MNNENITLNCSISIPNYLIDTRMKLKGFFVICFKNGTVLKTSAVHKTLNEQRKHKKYTFISY